MTTHKALDILGLKKPYTEDELKKTYRALMFLTHPDSGRDYEYKYEASDINAAYEYLIKNKVQNVKEKPKARRKTTANWNAPINPNAYCDREIYHNVEDSDGKIMGKAVIASGKYEWCQDEDFSLFLLSIYNSSKKIIIDSDEKKGQNRSEDIYLQGEVAYLLAQQFVDKSMILSMLEEIGNDSDGNKMYRVQGMLELTEKNIRLNDGEAVYPAGIKHHRLYVQNREGIVGYVSFKDDRLYYGIIPLFERRTVQVKMKIYKIDQKSRRNSNYYDIDLIMKILNEDRNRMMESINLKISNILEE